MARAAAACALAVLQTGNALGLSSMSRHQSLAPPKKNMGKEGCAPLANKGTHFTIDVEVGTPGQRFAVVADTGSNTLIVPSCLCQQHGRCPAEESCFTGTNKSTTFEMERTDAGPSSLVLTFGSGQIQGVVAKDKVKVGSVEAFLKDGLLLMTDRALNIQGAFEGILGLGVPQQAEDSAAVQAKQAAEEQTVGYMPPQQGQGDFQDIIQKILGQMQHGGGAQNGTVIDVEDAGAGGAPVSDTMRRIMEVPGSKGIISAILGRALQIGGPNLSTGQIPMEEILKRIMGDGGMGGGSPMMAPPMQRVVQRSPPKGFLEQASVDRFSVCFNDGASGVLRFGAPKPVGSHGGIGRQHWGVDFRGISIGKHNASPAEALFCRPENMTQGQQSPCGAIPDSGTTVLTGPQTQVVQLLDSICDNWERCRSNFTALEKATAAASETMAKIYGYNPFNLQGSVKKRDILQALLMDCESWMDEKVGLSELPPMHLHVQGSNGTKQTLRIPGNLYILETPRELLESVQLIIEDKYSPTIPLLTNASSQAKKVCSPALSVMEYNTKANGPVWILGTPLFYQFTVGYDVSTDPPSMTFTDQAKTPCGACDQVTQLFSDTAQEAELPRWPNGIRVNGKPRMPRIDTSQPL